MQTPGFFHQFPRLQPNDKLQEGLKADEVFFAVEKGVSWRDRLLLACGDVMVNVGKRLQEMSGSCPTGQSSCSIKKSTV